MNLLKILMVFQWNMCDKFEHYVFHYVFLTNVFIKSVTWFNVGYSSTSLIIHHIIISSYHLSYQSFFFKNCTFLLLTAALQILIISDEGNIGPPLFLAIINLCSSLVWFVMRADTYIIRDKCDVWYVSIGFVQCILEKIFPKWNPKNVGYWARIKRPSYNWTPT